MRGLGAAGGAQGVMSRSALPASIGSDGNRSGTGPTRLRDHVLAGKDNGSLPATAVGATVQGHNAGEVFFGVRSWVEGTGGDVAPLNSEPRAPAVTSHSDQGLAHRGNSTNSTVASALEVYAASLRTTQRDYRRLLSHVEHPGAELDEAMVQAWIAHDAEVKAMARTRKERSRPARCSMIYCSGCGSRIRGHERGEVHTKCPRITCHCGLPRLLHPAPLRAGGECHAEWIAILAPHDDLGDMKAVKAVQGFGVGDPLPGGNPESGGAWGRAPRL